MFSLNFLQKQHKYTRPLNNNKYKAQYYDGGNGNKLFLFSEKWVNQKGKFHRMGGPAYVQYNGNGNGLTIQESWFKHGVLYYVKHYMFSGLLYSTRRYYGYSGYDGTKTVRYRYVNYYDNGMIREERWCDKTKGLWRINFPAIITYYRDGAVKTETWVDDKGKIHRDSEPAIIFYFCNGYVELKKWYIHGTQSIEE